MEKSFEEYQTECINFGNSNSSYRQDCINCEYENRLRYADCVNYHNRHYLGPTKAWEF